MKAEFLTKLEYDRIVKDTKILGIIKRKKILIKLKQDLVYRDSKGEEHRAKKDLESDGSSQPQFTWSIIGHPFGEYLESSVIHDAICKARKMTWFKAAWVFLDAMKTQNVALWKRHVMHSAVKWVGYVPWKLKGKKEGEKKSEKDIDGPALQQ